MMPRKRGIGGKVTGRMRVCLFLAGVCIALAPWVGASARAQDESVPEAARGAGESVVLVESQLAAQPYLEGSRTVANTGFFVSNDGRVLTSDLTMGGCEHIEVRSPDGRRSEGRLLALDQRAGLALIETDLKDTVPLVLAEHPPEPMQWVAAATGRKGEGGQTAVSLHPGIVVATNAYLKVCGYTWQDMAVAELAPGPGSAAAPVLDSRGQVSGVVLSVQTIGDGSTLCYILPSDKVRGVLSELLEGKTHRVGWFGMVVGGWREAEGLLVLGVLQGGPADRAGLQPGDILLEIEGKPISGSAVFEDAVAAIEPGTTVELSYQRKGETEKKTARVEVAARPLLISRVRPAQQGAGPGAGAPSPGTDRLIRELQTQNRELRARVQLLEERVRELENQPSEKPQE